VIGLLKWQLRLCRILWDNRWQLVNAVIQEAVKVLESEMFWDAAFTATMEEIETEGRIQPKVKPIRKEG